MVAAKVAQGGGTVMSVRKGGLTLNLRSVKVAIVAQLAFAFFYLWLRFTLS